MGTSDGPPPIDGGPIEDTHVDGGGTCAADADSAWSHTACCNDNSCNGWCYLEDASVTCSCGQPPLGVLGGCPAGTVCCGIKNACVAPGYCDFSQ